MWKRLTGWMLVLAALGLPLAAQSQQRALPVLFDAPELHDGIWLNTETPLKLTNLRGQVVLLKMWTFDCINCIRSMPFVLDWHETYADDGLVVIGNHYPEFDYERELANLRAATQRLEITFPILQDNGRETWRAYNNRFWPTVYLIDKQGQVRFVKIGEGRYEQTEAIIQQLLAEPYEASSETPEAIVIDSLTPTDPLNVRSGPGTNFGRIGLIMPNEAYHVLDETDGWYQILFNGAQAYVSGEYVQVNSSE